MDSGSVALALAMFIGVLAQALGRHLRLPGIVLLLIAGVGLGPDGANLVRPGALGEALPGLVGFAIAIILFEGGLSLQFKVLRAQAKPIIRLVTIGALVTGALAAFAAYLVMGWAPQVAALFGCLVIVTGPTVVTPLVRQLRLSPRLSSILIAEGIFIDAVGATIAVVALELAIAGGPNPAAGGLAVVARIGAGALTGLAGGLFLAALLRVPRLVPGGLENVLVLATVVVTYHVSHQVVGESGISAAIMMGLVVGHAGIRLHDSVAEFNEELTSLLVATLFVLLAADVRMADVLALGWRGLAVVLLLMFAVRPATVWLSTLGTDLTSREKAYLSWVAPRGIVAAAVASLFALELGHAGVAGGVELRALVFVVIATTVTVQGLSAAWVGTWLGVRKPARAGYLILGANPLARLVAEVLQHAGQRVAMIDRVEAVAEAARAAGLAATTGDGLDLGVLEQVGVDGAAHAVGLTGNEHVNFLFARTIDESARGPELYVALERHDAGVTPAMLRRHDMRVLFAAEHELAAWHERARAGVIAIERWQLTGAPDTALVDAATEALLPLVLVRGGEAHLVSQLLEPRLDDELVVAVDRARLGEAETWLVAHGWSFVEHVRLTEAAPPDAP